MESPTKPSARNTAAASPNLIARISAKTELYSVPQISGRIEYTFVFGFQTVPVRKPNPYWWMAGSNKTQGGLMVQVTI